CAARVAAPLAASSCSSARLAPSLPCVTTRKLPPASSFARAAPSAASETAFSASAARWAPASTPAGSSPSLRTSTPPLLSSAIGTGLLAGGESGPVVVDPGVVHRPDQRLELLEVLDPVPLRVAVQYAPRDRARHRAEP